MGDQAAFSMLFILFPPLFFFFNLASKYVKLSNTSAIDDKALQFLVTGIKECKELLKISNYK